MSETKSTEAERIEQLHQLGLLDTSDETRFRCCVVEALKIFPGATIAAVTMVDVDRQWSKSIIGSDVRESPRSSSFCSHTIEGSGVMVVEDASVDPRFIANPWVTGTSHLRFYAGVKLVHRVGALCVMSDVPRRATKAEVGKLLTLARFVDIQLLAFGTLHNLGAASA
ncbi:GAF domain-containing protein [Acidisoma sp.]|uniref:GAF domain-containing protein n=1 Tax=Acidisoma sp. TaxID=1872115 RepID=UPI003AFF97FE